MKILKFYHNRKKFYEKTIAITGSCDNNFSINYLSHLLNGYIMVNNDVIELGSMRLYLN